MNEPQPRHVAVVGGGIAGLAAAYFLRELSGDDAPTTVGVYEASSRLGGKLALGEVGGVPVDLGAEALLARRPEAVELATAVGLADDLVHPATTAASIWSRDELRPMPRGHIMGVPGDLRMIAASGVLSTPGLARVRLDRVMPRSPQPGDVSVGRYVSARLGREVVDRLVEPLLGGVYAGVADELSLRATIPQLAPLVDSGSSLTLGVRDLLEKAAPASPKPVFAGIRGGVGRLPQAVAEQSGATIHTDTTVRALRRTETGWRLVTGSTRDERVVDADAVVLALPARPAARLLAPHSAAAATELATVDYASVAIATFVFPAAAFPEPLPGSGFLVPPVESHAIKAATFSSAKWSWLAAEAAGVTVIRTSLGRHHGEDELRRDDADLLDLAAADLAKALGMSTRPMAAGLHRWGGALPQYTVGHLDRVERVRAAVATLPALSVCGAAYDGVGVPACIASARRAADEIVAALSRATPGVDASATA